MQPYQQKFGKRWPISGVCEGHGAWEDNHNRGLSILRNLVTMSCLRISLLRNIFCTIQLSEWLQRLLWDAIWKPFVWWKCMILGKIQSFLKAWWWGLPLLILQNVPLLKCHHMQCLSYMSNTTGTSDSQQLVYDSSVLTSHTTFTPL